MACNENVLNRICNPIWIAENFHPSVMIPFFSIPDVSKQISPNGYYWYGSEPCLTTGTTTTEYYPTPNPLFCAFRCDDRYSSKSTDNETRSSCSPIAMAPKRHSSLQNFLHGNARNEFPDNGLYSEILPQRERSQSDGDRQVYKKRILKRYIEEEEIGSAKKRKTPPNDLMSGFRLENVEVKSSMTSSPRQRQTQSALDLSTINFSKHSSTDSAIAGHSSGDFADVKKPYKCEVCRKCFGRSDMLTRHTRLHTGAKPYSCNACNQVFSRSDHLSTHQRTHTGEKPYQCPQCSYAASRRDMITRHVKTHGRIKTIVKNLKSSTVARETKNSALENSVHSAQQTQVSVIKKVGN